MQKLIENTHKYPNSDVNVRVADFSHTKCKTISMQYICTNNLKVDWGTFRTYNLEKHPCSIYINMFL